MAERVPFVLGRGNPDVLTCIANLSNDEVFTPPTLVRSMLDSLSSAWASSHAGANLWQDSSVRFLDPCTKSGVFLREITVRLVEGLQDEIPRLEDRVEHILTNQVFGIATIYLTSLIARRSLYCSKFANGEHSICRSFGDPDGNIRFYPTGHVWTGATVFEEDPDGGGRRGVNGRCFYCGASQTTLDRADDLESHAYPLLHTDDVKAQVATWFGDDMQFDVVIGNPPYQLGQSGGDAVGGFAMPVYQRFVGAAKSLDPKYIVMITPSRWFAGGRGLDAFRAEMLADSRLRTLVDYPDAGDAFPGTSIMGGVSYFLWDRDWDGDCEVTTMSGGAQISPPVPRRLNTYDVLIRRNEAVPILEKVEAARVRQGLGTLAAKVSPIQPFSLRTNFRGAATPQGLRSPVTVLTNGDDTYVERDEIPRNDGWIDEWKVLLGSAYGGLEQVYNLPFVAPPGTACTETYLVIDRFSDQTEANRFVAYLKTKLVRFLVALRKNTQHLYSERFLFVPDMPMDREWTDASLCEAFGLTADEIAFVDASVRGMP